MRLQLERLENSPITSNCYILYSLETKRAIIIDPGSPDCEDVLSFLVAHQLIPDFIILTHEHFDHIWGAIKLKSCFNIPLIAHKQCADKIIDKKKNLSLFFNQVGFQLNNADLVFHNRHFTLNWNQDYNFELYHTPGHSEGAITILIDNYLFVGDTIIKDEKTVTKLPGGNKAALKTSLALIKNLSKRHLFEIFPGHGESFFLDDNILNFALDGK